MKLLLSALFLFSSFALGSDNYDDGYDDNPKPDADYHCEIKIRIEAEKEFRSRADARLWCASLTDNSDYCWVEKKDDRYKYLASLQVKKTFRYESQISYGDARADVFEQVWNYVEDGGYYKPIFQIVSRFGKCSK